MESSAARRDKKILGYDSISESGSAGRSVKSSSYWNPTRNAVNSLRLTGNIPRPYSALHVHVGLVPYLLAPYVPI